jgi:hypothetical protein
MKKTLFEDSVLVDGKIQLKRWIDFSADEQAEILKQTHDTFEKDVLVCMLMYPTSNIISRCGLPRVAGDDSGAHFPVMTRAEAFKIVNNR